MFNDTVPDMQYNKAVHFHRNSNNLFQSYADAFVRNSFFVK